MRKLTSGVCWIVLQVLALLSSALEQQRFANEPSPQTAVIGTTVVLPCRIINKHGVLQWTRDGFGLGNERELYAFKRYRMIGSDDEGDFSLRISPVTLEDEAEFQCQVTGSKEVPGVRSQTAKLTIYVPPEPPQITQGSVVQATAGQGVLLECISRGGKPAAEIQWLDNNGDIIRDGVHYSIELLGDGHRYNAMSKLSFIAKRQHHQASFTCTASNFALSQPLSTQVRLEVKYAPEVIIRHDQDGYKEGSTATLTCMAEANPPAVAYRWYRGGEAVFSSNSTQLTLENVRKSANMEDLTCEVSNEVGTTKKITRLSVHFAPSFSGPPADVYGEYGENVTLHCDVDSNPAATIVWVSSRSDDVVGSGPSLSVHVTSSTVDSYECIAKVEGYKEITRIVSLLLKGPPQVQAERVQWGHPGADVEVHCVVRSASPRSVSVVWSRKGRKIHMEAGRYNMTEEITTHGLHHTLLIHNAQGDDFGPYNCSVQNAFGSDVFEITLKQKRSLHLLLILSGIVGGVIFIILVAFAVIVCSRRTSDKSSKCHFNESKPAGIPEKTLTITLNDQNSTANDSDLKVEPDNRTGSSLSNKEGQEMESWDKEDEGHTSPNYLSGAASYLYPDNYTGIPLKMNGSPLSYGNYVSHSNLPGSQATPVTSGYSNSTYNNPLITASQHSSFQNYLDYETSCSQDASNGIQNYNSVFSNGLSGAGLSGAGLSGTGFPTRNFKTSAGLPFSLHLDTRDGSGSPNGPASNSIPRLGIPVDPSQYIVPPRTQMLQGTLATHV